MNKTIRYCLYGLIATVCVIAIFIGVFYQFFYNKDNANDVGVNITGSINTVPQTEINGSFKDLFTNEFFGTNYDDSNIKKNDSTKPLVYTYVTSTEASATVKTKVDGKYDITAYIPIVNIQGDIPYSYNTNTQNTFVSAMNTIIQQATQETIFNVSYTSYINDGILSLGIMCSLKEGENAQRTIVQAYNYNLETGEDVSIDDIMTKRGLDKNAVNQKIKSVVTKAAADAKSVSSSGYNIYERDTSSDIYDVNNVKNFMQGPNGELYIIYAYGNTSYTSSMDIIEI